jgi:hypothetical protein
MSLPIDPSETGINANKTQFLDLATAPVTRRVSPADRTLTQAQAKAYQQGDVILTEAQASPLPPAPPAMAPVQTLNSQTGPNPQQALPIPQGPEIRPNDPPRFQERINQLYGRAKTAEERASAAEGRMAELLSRLEARVNNPSAPQVPFTNQYSSFPNNSPQESAYPTFEPQQQSQPQPAGQYVSRAELQAMLMQQTQAIAQQTALQQAHTVSRLEAERNFPTVFQNPELRAAADDVWSRDPYLRNDPRGPEKAAAQVLGLAYGHVPFSQGAQSIPTQVRKEMISAAGPTVAEGSAAPDDRVARYQAALAQAARTQDLADFARARRIAQGLE